MRTTAPPPNRAHTEANSGSVSGQVRPGAICFRPGAHGKVGEGIQSVIIAEVGNGRAGHPRPDTRHGLNFSLTSAAGSRWPAHPTDLGLRQRATIPAAPQRRDHDPLPDQGRRTSSGRTSTASLMSTLNPGAGPGADRLGRAGDHHERRPARDFLSRIEASNVGAWTPTRRHLPGPGLRCRSRYPRCAGTGPGLSGTGRRRRRSLGPCPRPASGPAHPRVVTSVEQVRTALGALVTPGRDVIEWPVPSRGWASERLTQAR